MAKLLIVDDDQRLIRALHEWLTFQGHQVECLEDGKKGLDRALEETFDVLILDWAVPGLSGIDVCKQYRKSGGLAKVIILTGKSTVRDKVTGLDAGADDYLTKPFSPEELSARLRALFRRTRAEQVQDSNLPITHGYLKIDPKAKEVTTSGSPVQLSAREFALLEFLMRNPNEAFSANELLDHVWSKETEVSSDAIRVYITRIREKIDREGEESAIKTIHRVGYKFVPPAGANLEFQ